MTVDTINYSLTVESGKQYLTNKLVGNDSLQLDVYAYTDTNLATSLLTYSLDESEKYNITLTNDGRYWLVLTYTGGSETYEFVYYPFFKKQTLAELQSFLCDCTYKKNVTSGCIGCEEIEDLDAFSFLTFIPSYLYLFLEKAQMTYFYNYMHIGLKEHESQLAQIFTDMFWAKNIRGNYSFDIRTLKIYYSYIYVYLYEQDLTEDTNSDYVDTTYNISDVKKCIDKIGLFFQNIVQVFTDEVALGKIYIDELTNIVTPCTEVSDLTLNPTLRKSEMEEGIDIVVSSVSKYIILIIPKIWGSLTEIRDNGEANLITDFTKSKCGNYYLYKINYLLPPNNYTFKIII